MKTSSYISNALDGRFDIAVVGCGPAGFGAAVRAAREGRKVIVVDLAHIPGGVHTTGLQGSVNRGVGGIHTELMRRFRESKIVYTVTEREMRGWAGNPLSHYDWYLSPGDSFCRESFNPQLGGQIMYKMLSEVGVETWFGARCIDASYILRDGRKEIRSITVTTVEGCYVIEADIFIDGTGSSLLVAMTGGQYKRGGGTQPAIKSEEINAPIPSGLLWIMSGVDFEALYNYQIMEDDPLLKKIIHKAQLKKKISDVLYRPRLGGREIYGTQYIGHPTLDLSPMLGPGTFVLWQNVPYDWKLHPDEKNQDWQRANAELRGLIKEESMFLQEDVPGFNNAYVVDVGECIGVRDGRHPIGEHTFTIDDARQGIRFSDAVTEPLTKCFFWDDYRNYTFEVPYRSFLPKGYSNLLLSGASLSLEYETLFMVMRNFPWCLQTGEVAGYAASVSLREGVAPNELKWTEKNRAEVWN